MRSTTRPAEGGASEALTIWRDRTRTALQDTEEDHLCFQTSRSSYHHLKIRVKYNSYMMWLANCHGWNGTIDNFHKMLKKILHSS